MESIDVATGLGDVAKSLLTTVASLKAAEPKARRSLGDALEQFGVQLQSAADSVTQDKVSQIDAARVVAAAALLRSALLRILGAPRGGPVADTIDHFVARFPANREAMDDAESFADRLQDAGQRFTVLADVVRPADDA